ncbi:MAG TPA: FHA domain-containing protein, partial [Humisphaera sp.]
MPLHVRLTLPTGTKTLKLPDRGNDRPVVFGRSAAAAVKVPAHTPQEDHCGLFVHDGQWYACDLYQAGQVLVNGHPADEPTPVQQGDVVTIGPAGGPSIEVGAVVAPAAAPAAYPPAGGPPPQHRPPARYEPQQPAY